MKGNKFYFLALSLLFTSITFTAIDNAVADSHEGIRAAIEAVMSEWTKQVAAGNGAGVAALYTEDAQLLPPNSDFVAGREAIAGVWQAMIDSGVTDVKLDTIEVTGMGEKAAEVGSYELMDAEGKVVDRGKYMVFWKKEGSDWKLHRDIWNTSLPAPGSGESN